MVQPWKHQSQLLFPIPMPFVPGSLPMQLQPKILLQISEGIINVSFYTYQVNNETTKKAPYILTVHLAPTEMLHVSCQTIPSKSTIGLALHTLLFRKSNVNPWHNAINKYIGASHFVETSVRGELHMRQHFPISITRTKRKVMILNARAAFQLASRVTASG